MTPNLHPKFKKKNLTEKKTVLKATGRCSDVFYDSEDSWLALDWYIPPKSPSLKVSD